MESGEVYNASMALSESPLMTAGGLVRLTYGLGAMFAPRFVAGRYAAAEPDSVMNLRGFGGQHIAIAIFTLFSAPLTKDGPPRVTPQHGD